MKKLKCPSEELWTHGSLVRKLLFLLFWFVGISAFGQTDKQISVSFVNEDAVSALRKVEELSGQKIQYNYEDVNFRVTYRATNATATKIITDIIKNHNLKLQRKGNYLVIMPETKKLYKGSVIEGKIVDEHGEPLIGASVQMRGSGKGVITDVNGNYSFVPSTNEGTVIISYIGYTTQEISLERFADMRRINMKLDQDNVLKDVVITGIYTRNVESFTGSATTFSEKELKQIGNGNALQSLKTLDPSFILLDNNTMGSDPNQTLQIEVRGKTNVAGLTEEYVNDPNQPLFILDGFESTLATISDLSMDRVQSITLLKDAAATAI
ncbi:MAG: carboxypeptidase-like regulatory domain-containing protein, partial [Prevotella sp.]|nr:carboxypeptidase-like regulatory domain-containing protein [Prevotella sp.]